MIEVAVATLAVARTTRDSCIISAALAALETPSECLHLVGAHCWHREAAHDACHRTSRGIDQAVKLCAAGPVAQGKVVPGRFQNMQHVPTAVAPSSLARPKTLAV